MNVLMWILLVLCLVSLGWTIHCSITYYQFSENVKNWVLELDDAMLEAVDNAARRILIEMDERITKSKEEDLNNDNKIEEDEKDVLKQES